MLPIQEYSRFDALGLAELIRKREVSAEEVLEAALTRTREVNGRINAIVVPMFEEARSRARQPLPTGAFTGVPFLLKDLGAYYTGFRTTSGCRFNADYVADHDSELVRRYKNAGLVIFGKAATPEFGLTTSTESALFGPTRNPWNPERTAGGSSGGSAAAVAAGIVPAAHATDGGGSIRIPASCCGLFGLKPTRARVSLGPDLGEGWSGLSCAHAVSRTVRDSAALLDAAAGPAPGDPYWAPPPVGPFLEQVGRPPGKLRIALTKKTFNGSPMDPECVAAVEDAARLCAELGHDVAEAAPAVDYPALGQATRIIVGANILANLRERATALGREHTANDVEPLTRATAEDGKAIDAARYASSIRTVHRVGRQVAAFFADFDLLLSPTMATPPKPLGILSLSNPNPQEYLSHLLQTIGFTQLMNVAGVPAMSVPLAWSREGLPIGIQFAAPFGEEARLFRLAAQLEQARPWADRRPSV
jgi:Asp-tRNA(Asn)/Glu-tRNA(Gln) amidotransferase A subunit family amidase